MIDYHGNEFERMIGRSRLVTEDQRMALVRQPHEKRGCCGPGSVVDDYANRYRLPHDLVLSVDPIFRSWMHKHGEGWHYHPGGSQPHPNDFDHSVDFPLKRLDETVK